MKANMQAPDMRGGTEIVYDYVKQFEVGSELTADDIFKEVGKASSINNGIGRMVRFGVLEKIGTGHYRLTKRVNTFGLTYKFKARRKPNRRKKPVRRTQAQQDMDVIEELLDVMARAEPVLKRMKKMRDAMREFTGD